MQNTVSKYPVITCSLDLSVIADKNHREYPRFLPVGLVLTEVRPDGDHRGYSKKLVSCFTVFLREESTGIKYQFLEFKLQNVSTEVRY